MEYRHHWSLILASWITLAHLSVSAAMSFSKSLGDIGIGTLPRSARRPLILGSARAAFISLLSLSTISPDVFLGAPMPCQVLASKPGTDSATVGTSGSARERVAVVTATRPPLAAFDGLDRFGRGADHPRPLPADQVGERGRATAIRHMEHVDMSHQLKQLAADMGHASAAARRHADRARV